MSQYNKAIVAIIGGIVVLLGAFGINPVWLDEGVQQSIAAILTPILVYLIPNKE